MTHLRIELNTITENVTSNVIHKLYETAKAIIDAEEANEVQESLVSLKGNLLVSKAYGDEIDWLETKFPDLHITASDRYIRFADPEVLRVLLANNIGDGTGVTVALAATANIDRLFKNNTTITSFDEYDKFIQANGRETLFRGCTNLRSINLSNVSCLGLEAFRGCTSLTSLNIGGTPNGNFYGVFRNCKNLLSVVLPNSFTTIREYYFLDCSNLTTINLSRIQTIGCFAFAGTKITTADLSSCTNLDYQAFYGCTSLASVTLSPLLTTIKLGTFQNCSSLSSIDLSNITSIEGSNNYGAFQGCTSLTSVDLSSCTTIGIKAFKNTPSLRGNIVLNLTQSTITDGVFKGSGIDTIKIVDTNCTGIYNGSGSGVEPVFDSCSNLTSIDLTGCTSLTKVGPIINCGNLKTVLLPASVNDLAYNAFNGCWALETLVVPNTTMVDFATGNNALYFIRTDTVKIYVPDNLVSSYQSYDNGRYANRIYSMNDMSADLKAMYGMS